MKNFWKVHYERILIIVALVLLAVLTLLYIWGAQFLLSSFDRATDIQVVPEGITHFNVTGAAEIGGTN